MEHSLKKLLVIVALAALVAAPAVAKSRTHPHQTAPTQAHRNSTAINGKDIRDYETRQMLGTDPDPQVRFELRRDGSSSWEAD